MNLFLKRPVFYILLISTIIMIVLMSLQGKPLKTAATPAGIVSLELAATPGDIDAVLDAWAEASTGETDIIQTAVGNTRLDFAFLFCYALFLFTCASQLAVHFPGKKILPAVGGVALIAGLLDIIENIGMLQSLQVKVSAPVAAMTAIAAYFKFILLLIVILVLVIALAIKMMRRKNQELVMSDQ